jgi:hypothetical protein
MGKGEPVRVTRGMAFDYRYLWPAGKDRSYEFEFSKRKLRMFSGEFSNQLHVYLESPAERIKIRHRRPRMDRVCFPRSKMAESVILFP